MEQNHSVSLFIYPAPRRHDILRQPRSPAPGRQRRPSRALSSCNPRRTCCDPDSSGLALRNDFTQPELGVGGSPDRATSIIPSYAEDDRTLFLHWLIALPRLHTMLRRRRPNPVVHGLQRAGGSVATPDRHRVRPSFEQRRDKVTGQGLVGGGGHVAAVCPSSAWIRGVGRRLHRGAWCGCCCGTYSTCRSPDQHRPTARPLHPCCFASARSRSKLPCAQASVMTGKPAGRGGEGREGLTPWCRRRRRCCRSPRCRLCASRFNSRREEGLRAAAYSRSSTRR